MRILLVVLALFSAIGFCEALFRVRALEFESDLNPKFVKAPSNLRINKEVAICGHCACDGYTAIIMNGHCDLGSHVFHSLSARARRQGPGVLSNSEESANNKNSRSNT